MQVLKAVTSLSLAFSNRHSGYMPSQALVQPFRPPAFTHSHHHRGLSQPFLGHRSHLSSLRSLSKDELSDQSHVSNEAANDDRTAKKSEQYKQSEQPKKSDIKLANPLAQEALQRLTEGNERFRQGKSINYQGIMQRVYATANGQSPHSAIVGCMDSRASADLIFDQTIGDIFSLRVAGNVVNPHILGSLEYACVHVGTPLIVVAGHTHCGAIRGAIAACSNADDADESYLSGLLKDIKPAIDASKLESSEKNADAIAKSNVYQSMRKIREQSPDIFRLLKDKKIDMVGAMYDVKSGKVDFFEALD